MDKDSVYSAIFGQIVADALGVPYEFTHENNCSDMIGHGTYNKEEGTWSDDSSLTLALLDSLKDGVNYDDIMDKFMRWYFDGEYTSDGDVFDIGITTQNALYNYKSGVDALMCGGSEENENGNGSLMRIMPIILYMNSQNIPIYKQVELINDISSLTHSHIISKTSCNVYNFIIQEILNNPQEDDLRKLIIDGLNKSEKYCKGFSDSIDEIYDSNFFLQEKLNVKGTGFVVDSLKIALYYSYYSKSYEDTLLDIVRLGGYTDTNAMICGGILGLFYGYRSIPQKWLELLKNKELVYELCDNFYDSII